MKEELKGLKKDLKQARIEVNKDYIMHMTQNTKFMTQYMKHKTRTIKRKREEKCQKQEKDGL